MRSSLKIKLHLSIISSTVGWEIFTLKITHMKNFYQESQGSLAVVFDQTFTSGNGDLGANLFTDHRHIILFFAC